jgi:hypothetical protein
MEAGVTRHEHAVGSTLWLPLFDELSDPTAVARLAAKEEARLVQRPRVPVWVAGAAGDQPVRTLRHHHMIGSQGRPPRLSWVGTSPRSS